MKKMLLAASVALFLASCGGAGNKTAFALKTFDQAASNGIKNLAKMGAAAGIAAGAIGYKLASAAYESQKVMAQTEAIINASVVGRGSLVV